MFLGIDLGTSELKLVLLASDGLIVGTACQPLGISRLRPRWSEQDPEDSWQATRTALSALREKYPDAFARIQAIGLSGQMHGAVLLDANDRPLCPAILWNDMRGVSECNELTARAPRLQEIAGNCAMPGLTAPKLLWIARHEPEHFRKLACVLLPKDYLRLRLTGVKLTDPSDASGTLWLDVARREWSGADVVAGPRGGLSSARYARLSEPDAAIIAAAQGCTSPGAKPYLSMVCRWLRVTPPRYAVARRGNAEVGEQHLATHLPNSAAAAVARSGHLVDFWIIRSAGDRQGKARR